MCEAEVCAVVKLVFAEDECASGAEVEMISVSASEERRSLSLPSSLSEAGAPSAVDGHGAETVWWPLHIQPQPAGQTWSLLAVVAANHSSPQA